MRTTFRLLTGSIIAASALSLSPRANGQATTSPPANATHYSSAESDFVVGKAVFLRSSKMRIGTIMAADSNHGFPRTFPRPRMKAVLIRWKNGPTDWVPVEGITRIYVVNR